MLDRADVSGVPRLLLIRLVGPKRVEQLAFELRRAPSDEEIASQLGLSLEELGDRLGRAIGAISEHQRRVISLRHYEGRTPMEISTQLGFTQARIDLTEVLGVLSLRAVVRKPLASDDFAAREHAVKLWKLGAELYRLGRFKPATDRLHEAALELRPLPTLAWLWVGADVLRAAALARLGRCEEARELFYEAVHRGDSRVDLRYLIPIDASACEAIRDRLAARFPEAADRTDEEVAEAIAGLRTGEQWLVDFYFCKGLAPREMAEVLSLAEGVVLKRLSTSTQELGLKLDAAPKPRA